MNVTQERTEILKTLFGVLGSGIPRILEAYSQEVFGIRQSFIRIVLPYARHLISLLDIQIEAENIGLQSPTQSRLQCW